MRRLGRPWRIGLPFLAAVLCLLVARWLPPVPMWLVTMLAFGFVFDGALALMPRTGGIGDHRQ